ncbi:DUF3604 domain-containing protein [Colwellia psychrerythraea]|uniref:Uncharacterized protein n=1 Tax=Colwellia psychrerythraea TaxID=28229 RepID=A0A099KD31_COLPS|nr:DUF3604 domain-containing protein [Colwellia psychrerythraea]KGJ88604.1 Protein of unknown function DUF3604 [Colwellia psychrerythraea]
MKPIRSKSAITAFLMAALTGNSTFAFAEIKVEPEAAASTNKAYPNNVYFGDTHHHTSNSADAFMNGNRMGPEEAYRFAMGEKITSNSGVPVMLSRPLDFLVIADHAEGLGIMYEVYEENPTFMKDKTLQRWSKAMKAGGKAAVDATNEVIAAQAQGTLPTPLTDPKTTSSVMKTVWEKNTAIAEQYNDPGNFTAMIGYEWSSVPGGNNMHRNVLYRGNKKMADQMVPFNSWQSQDPEKLWDWMESYEKKTGDKVLAITLDEVSENELLAPKYSSGDAYETFKTLSKVVDAVPFLRSFIVNTGARTVEKEERTGKSFNIFGNLRDIRFNEMEYSVPAELGMACLREILDAIKKQNIDVIFPLEVRYIKADDIWLSPFYQRDSCAISCHNFHDKDYKKYFSIIEPIFWKYSGRPHWGKIHTLTAKDQRASYPMFDEFLRVRQAIDPKAIFTNSHINTVLGLS